MCGSVSELLIAFKINDNDIKEYYESKEDIVSIDESVSDMFGKFKEWILNLLKRIKGLIERFLSKFDYS